MVLKTTFGQSQRLSLIRCTLSVENKEKNCLNFQNKVLNRKKVIILGGLNSGISLYILFLILAPKYSQTSVKQPPRVMTNFGCLREVAVQRRDPLASNF